MKTSRLPQHVEQEMIRRRLTIAAKRIRAAKPWIKDPYARQLIVQAAEWIRRAGNAARGNYDIR
jgi:hypothetical protein